MARRAFPNLRAYRVASGDKNQDMAREMGIAPSFMSMIISGDRRPGLVLALKIANRYNVPLESLVHSSHKKAS